MPTAISVDLRRRILVDCDHGMKHRDVAEKFSVSLAFLKKLRRQRARTGSIAPRPCRSGRKRVLLSREAEIRQLVDSGQVRTCDELRERLGATCTTKTVWTELRRLEYRFKKKR